MTRNRRAAWTAAFFLACGLLWGGLSWGRSLLGGPLLGAYQLLAPKTPSLAAWTPPGALLAIEARDFGSLLKDWSTSAEQRAWLASDNYAGFSRSRLFSRLGEAQQQFAESAGMPADMSFLTQVAGKESLFAWYDIGNLEFLYITHLPANSAGQTALVEQRGKFEVRTSGSDTFYVRTSAGADGSGQTRTVAFATHGDYLLLATREDLLANALLLMQGQPNLNLTAEHWYSASTQAATGPAGDLRMTLNLAAIVPSPYFRSYWVQGNISEMKQYSAAESDLYRTPESFHEERVLLPKTAETPAEVNLAPVLQYLPQGAGVYRASANPTAGQVVAALTDKLLFRDVAAFRNDGAAPVADLSPQTAGAAGDLETRIDVPPLPAQPLDAALEPLHSLLDAAQVNAMLTSFSTAEAAVSGADPLFMPIHSTVVLSASGPWDAVALESALTAALQARLTAGVNGLEWQPRTRGAVTWFELQGLQPLAFAIEGKICVLASDSETLLKSFSSAHGAEPAPEFATVAAGFNHTAERAHFARITALLDRRSPAQQQNQPDTPPGQPGNGDGQAPAFFAGNLRSLSDTFQGLDAETFLERPDAKADVVRQTVVYQWRR